MTSLDSLDRPTGAVPSHLDLLIGGERTPAADGATFGVTDPSTGQQLATVAKAGPADLERAIATARSSFDSGVWADVDATARGKVLLRAAALVRERSEAFAWAEVANAGHTIEDARWEAGAMADVFEYYSGAADKHLGSVVPTPDAGLGWC